MYLKTDFPARSHLQLYELALAAAYYLRRRNSIQATGHYLGNTVVFAQYVGQRAAAP